MKRLTKIPLKLAFCLLSLCSASPAIAVDHALIIGVGNYKFVGPKPLKGVEHDVVSVSKAMKDVFNVPAKNITVLHDKTATRKAILSSLDKLAAQLTSKDRLYIYYSGHGTSGKDRNIGEIARLIPHQSGAMIPYDVAVKSDAKTIYQSLVVGRRDLQPRLKKLDQKGVETYMFSDSCYSGNAVRSVSSHQGWTSRALNLGFDQDDLSDCSDCETNTPNPRTPYPYKNVYFMSAAAETEAAMDIDHKTIDRYPTIDGKFHGAFTDALLRVWYGKVGADANKDNRLDIVEMSRGVSCFMERRGYIHEPQLLPSRLDLMEASRTRHAQLIPVMGQASYLSSVSLSLSLQGSPKAWKRRLQKAPDFRLQRNGADLNFKFNGDKARVFNAAGDYVGEMRFNSLEDLQTRISMERWVKQLKQGHCAGSGPQAVLQLGLRGQGTNFRFGDSVPIQFSADKAAYWLLLDVYSTGEVQVLYPYKRDEFEAVPASEVIAFPTDGEFIRAGDPAGIDSVIALAFEQKPKGFERWAKELSGKTYRSKLVQQLEAFITSNPDQVGISVVDLRVSPKS